VATRRRILGELLVHLGFVERRLLEEALLLQRQSHARIGATLVEMGATCEEDVARALAVQLGIDYAAAPLCPEDEAARMVRPELAHRHHAVPLRATDHTIAVAMADPLDLTAIDDLAFQTGRRIEPVSATPSGVREALAVTYPSEDVLDRLADALPTHATPRQAAGTDLERVIHATPVVRLVEGILHRAVERGASDIHVEETEAEVRVRVRIDGVLQRVVDLPPEARRAVLSRIKVIAGMDISVRRRAQDGRAALTHGGRHLTLRVSTLPVHGGEKAVVRILEAEAAPRGPGELGMSARDLTRMRALLGAGHGVMLAAGPTGCGKSTTLFAGLSEIDREALNVVTLEDPVEYRLAGANQVQVNPKAGLGFAEALRSVLRQDPDVVMVGEIRDRETAEIAMAAAVTGHLVLSSINTRDAPGAITRLLHMGVPPYLVAGGLSGVVAQRLVRRVCSGCGGRASGGCRLCHDGMRGRTGVFQVLVMTDALRDEITGGASAARLRRLAHQSGMASLAEDARRNVAEGVTTPSEIARIVRGDPGGVVPCPRCGAAVPTGAHGCPFCGNLRMRTCRCGQALAREWHYCPSCVRRVAA